MEFLDTIDASIPAEDGVTINPILDNSGTHKTPRVKRWLVTHPRFAVHFTPTSDSWPNRIERFFAEITQKQIRRGSFRSVKALENAIGSYLEEHNKDPKPFRWTASADLILRKVEEVANELTTQDTRRSRSA